MRMDDPLLTDIETRIYEQMDWEHQTEIWPLKHHIY